jgi:hypothetical protein
MCEKNRDKSLFEFRMGENIILVQKFREAL